MKICEITGKVAQVGNNVSHSNKKTKRRFNPNLKTKRFWSEEEGRWITLKVSAAGIPLSFCSMHSRITCTLLPFFAMMFRDC